MENDELTDRIRKLESLVFALVGSSQYQMQKDARFYDGRNIQVGFTTGTMFGTDPNQKLGFFGNTPVVKPSTPATLGDVIALLQSLGLSK